MYDWVQASEESLQGETNGSVQILSALAAQPGKLAYLFPHYGLCYGRDAVERREIQNRDAGHRN